MHLPCDSLVATSGNGAPWRIVTAGQTPCLSCGAAVEASCSAAGNAAACCRHEGNGCSDLGLDAANAGGGIGAECSIGGQMVCSACDDPSLTPTTARVGRYVAVGRTMSHSAAIDYCEEMHQSLASVHSWEEQQQAASACQAYASDQDDQPFSCWLGFIDLGQEGGFVWLDGSSVEYVHWSPGEPNESRTVTRDGEDGKTLKPSLDRMQTILKEHCAAVEMDFRASRGNWGGWNDADESDAYSAFPICETRIPAPVPGEPLSWGTATTHSFRIRACVDHIDDINFQDDRLWIQCECRSSRQHFRA